MLACPGASLSSCYTLAYTAESVRHLLVTDSVPGLIIECGRYKAIVQLGFAWQLIARISEVRHSDMG